MSKKDFWGWNAYGEVLFECPYCGFEPSKCSCFDGFLHAEFEMRKAVSKGFGKGLV